VTGRAVRGMTAYMADLDDVVYRLEAIERELKKLRDSMENELNWVGNLSFAKKLIDILEQIRDKD
jgi:hypothetical protein